MIDNTDSFQNFPTCSWHATEVYYILLFIRQWHSFSVMVFGKSVMVFGKSVMVGVGVSKSSVMVGVGVSKSSVMVGVRVSKSGV